MKNLILAAILLSATNVFAAPGYRIVKQNLSSEKYQSEVVYPQFAAGSVPAAAAINDSIKETIIEGGCDADEAKDSDFGYSYNARAGVVAMNQNYIGIEVASDDYCGGAHPNYGIWYITYDSRTGQKIEMSDEFPNQRYNDDQDPDEQFKRIELLQRKIAKLMLASDQFKKSQAEECVGEGTQEEKIASLVQLYPSISGLGRNKQIIVSLSPAHVLAVCAISIRVDYKSLASELAPQSRLHQWLK